MSNPFAGLNLSFRPSAKLVPLLLSQVKGTVRRQVIQKAMEDERLEDLPDALLQSSLSPEARSASAACNPALMGGEYLPDLLEGELEIARIEMASSTADVISVRLRRTEEGLVYRVVDAYQDEEDRDEATSVDATPRVRENPMSLGELGEFVMQAAKIEDILILNEFYTLDEALDFFAGSSVYYPDFARYLDAYIAGVMPENEEDEEDEEGEECAADDEDDQQYEEKGEEE